MSEKEWEPWIEHDGRSCPEGKYVHVVFCDGTEAEGIAGHQTEAAVADGLHPLVGWLWRLVPTETETCIYARIVRYRIRKPRALQELKERIATLPEEVDA